VTLQADALWHPALLINRPGAAMPLYLGIGGSVGNHHHHHVDGMDEHVAVAVRAPLGVALELSKVPLDVFFELALVANLTDVPHSRLDLDGALGARYYF
jgi:hypothetical protein